MLEHVCPEAVMVSHLHALSVSAMLGLLHFCVDTLTLLWSQVPSIPTMSDLAGDVGSPMPASDAAATLKAGSLDFLWGCLSKVGGCQPIRPYIVLVAKQQPSFTRAPVCSHRVLYQHEFAVIATDSHCQGPCI